MKPLLLLCITTSLFAADPEWFRLAKMLRNTSGTNYERVVKELRDIPKLENHLRAALGKKTRYFALEVITSLHLDSLWSDLISLSRFDEEGSVYLTLNSLLTERNQQSLAIHYRQRLNDTISIPVRVILLDTLARLGENVPLNTLLNILRSTNYEEKDAVLLYTKARLRAKHWEYMDVLQAASRSTPFQVRMRALHIASELPALYRAMIFQPFKCKAETHEQVRMLCTFLKG